MIVAYRKAWRGSGTAICACRRPNRRRSCAWGRAGAAAASPRNPSGWRNPLQTKRIETQLEEKKTVILHFAMRWSTSARVDFYLWEKQTRRVDFYLWEKQIRACSWGQPVSPRNPSSWRSRLEIKRIANLYWAQPSCRQITTGGGTRDEEATWPLRQLGLYKMFFYFQSFVHESIVLSFFWPACIAHTVAILLHNYWAIYDPPPTSFVYAIHHRIVVIAISCKGQLPAPTLRQRCYRGVNPSAKSIRLA